MNPEQQNCADHALHDSRMVDAGIAQVAHRGTRQNIVPRHVLEWANVRLDYDQSAGWPPTLAGCTDRRYLTASRAESSFDLKAQRNCRDAALKHPEVVSHLVGRWETLGIHLVSHRDVSCQVYGRARACFYNYTTNQLIEAYIEDGIVTRVRIAEPYEHPEAPVEMAQAIGLARAHPQIKDRVASLTAHAILQVPMDPSGPSYKHRCLFVMFTEQDDSHRELPVLFSALIDLCEQRVLAFSNCPCVSDARHDDEQGTGRTPRSKQ